MAPRAKITTLADAKDRRAHTGWDEFVREVEALFGRYWPDVRHLLIAAVVPRKDLPARKGQTGCCLHAQSFADPRDGAEHRRILPDLEKAVRWYVRDTRPRRKR